MGRRCIDLTGQRFGRLVVVERAQNIGARTAWLCKCQCGNEHIALGGNLRQGNATSCGCYHREIASKVNTKHQKSRDKNYIEWSGIKTRCYNEMFDQYINYGGRGITMCDRWRESFEAFYEDVSKLPHFGEKGYSLNRIDNDGNYEPNNVEWSDKIVQANNKRNNRLLTYNGKTQTMAQWSKDKKIPSSVIFKRLSLGWSVDEILTKPVRQYKKLNDL